MASDGDSDSTLGEILSADVVKQNAYVICLSIFDNIRGG